VPGIADLFSIQPLMRFRGSGLLPEFSGTQKGNCFFPVSPDLQPFGGDQIIILFDNLPLFRPPFYTIRRILGSGGGGLQAVQGHETSSAMAKGINRGKRPEN